MTKAENLDAPAAPPALRKEIWWICQSVRFAALGYALWTLLINLTFWSDAARINDGYSRLLQRDLSGIAPGQQLGAFGVNFLVWLLASYACYCGWRLFSTYLQGHIFTLQAALWLLRLALWGLAAQALSIAMRPLISVILTWHFPPDQKLRVVNMFLQPNDVSTLLLLLGLLALGHIQKTAAEIAGEHAQFV